VERKPWDWTNSVVMGKRNVTVRQDRIVIWRLARIERWKMRDGIFVTRIVV